MAGPKLPARLLGVGVYAVLAATLIVLFCTRGLPFRFEAAPETMWRGGGHAFAVAAKTGFEPWLTLRPDSAQDAARSVLRLFEDGRALGPPHTSLAVVARDGGGRYGHWNDNTLIFSASDSSDPRMNGRTYVAEGRVFPEPWLLPLLLVLAALGAGIVCLMFHPPQPAERAAHPPYRADVDGMRAIAVIAVILFHASPRLLPGGFLGVDVFFVISGFLISSLILRGLERGSFSFADFYVRRIKRIFPALTLVLAGTLAIGTVVLLADELKQLGWHIAAAAIFVPNVLLWSEAGYFDRASELKPLLHLWSLGVEEQFYLVWPLLVVAAWKFRSGVPALIVTVILASFAVNVVRVGPQPAETFFLPPARFWELLAGSALAYALMGAPLSVPPRWRNVAAAAGLALIAASLFIIDRGKALPGWWALAPAGGTVLLIGAGEDAWVNRKLLANAGLVFVGLISYPLYLWHWPLLSFLRIANHDTTIARAAAIALAGALAILTYRLLERPVRARRPLLASRAVVASLVAGAFTVGALGVAVVEYGGFPGRLSEPVQRISAYRYNYTAELRVGVCHLNDSQEPEEFAPACYGEAGRRADILLWGDSFAADLYAPLMALNERQEFSIAQFTASACPPFLVGFTPSAQRPHCQAVNEFVAGQLAKIKPRVVILSLRADVYRYKVLDTIAETVRVIRQAGVEHIVWIGMRPMWAQPVPKLIARAELEGLATGEAMATRMEFPARDYAKLAAADDHMRRMADELGIIYWSPLAELCERHSCIVMANGEPVAWDHFHFTKAGGRLMLRPLFSKLPSIMQEAKVR